LKEEAGTVTDDVRTNGLLANGLVTDGLVTDGRATDGPAADDPAGIVAARIRSQIGRQVWTCIGTMGGEARAPRSVCPSGFRGIDRLLPGGGIGRGSLVEWIGGPASGATSLAFAVASRLLAARPATAGKRPAAGDPPGATGTILVVDRRGRFHPPAVLPWLERSTDSRPKPGGQAIGPLVVVRPAQNEDEIWAIDQALRCPGVTAVLAWPEQISSTAMRRLQLAARGSGAVGFLVRPERARREPSWAEARLNVTTVSSGPGRFGANPSAGGVPSPSGQATEVRLVGSLAVRRMRVALQEGPWSCALPPDVPAVEVTLDMATGCEAHDCGAFGSEAFGRGEGGGDRAGWSGGRGMPASVPTSPAGGVQCRAS
jgi:hypothetical protein